MGEMISKQINKQINKSSLQVSLKLLFKGKHYVKKKLLFNT